MFTMRRVAWASKQAAAAPAGQVVLLTGTTSWTVPAGVTSISVVAVQGGSNPNSGAPAVTVTINSTIVCRAQNENRIGDGGGNAGTQGNGGSDYETYTLYGGGSGAGGYSGNGGNGGSNDGFSIVFPTSGNGGGGGGGGFDNSSLPGNGGSVGLLGQGSNGAAGNQGQDGGNGSSGTALGYGAGAKGVGNYYPNMAGGRGGALSYKNNIAVTPGQAVTLSIPATIANAGPAAVRIIWGAGRSFPSTNTGDV